MRIATKQKLFRIGKVIHSRFLKFEKPSFISRDRIFEIFFFHKILPFSWLKMAESIYFAQSDLKLLHYFSYIAIMPREPPLLAPALLYYAHHIYAYNAYEFSSFPDATTAK